MDKEFTMQLAEPEAEYLNTILPKNHSVQVYEKYERRKKAEKKLDDMYVAEFSLRPTKKLKRQSETIPDKNQKLSLNNQKPNYQETFVSKNQPKKSHLKDVEAQLLKVKPQLQQESIEKQHRKNQIEVRQIRPSRSQRMSKPTEVFKQFQQETFKRKIVEKQDEKAQPVAMNFLNERQLKMQKRHQIEKMNQEQNDCESENIPIQTKQNAKKQQPNKKMEQMSEEKPNDTKEMRENKKIDVQAQIDRNLEKQLHRQKQQTIKNQVNIQRKEQTKNKIQTNVNAQNDCLKDCSMDCQEDCSKDCPKIKKQHQFSQNKEGEQSNSKINSKRCHLILQKLRSHKSSWPFKHPVDPEKQGVPDYYEKIKHPMDLKTIQKKLKSSKYQSDEQFFSDIELMLHNSFDYNPVNTPVYKRTTQLQQAFQKYKNSDNLEKYDTKKSSAGQHEQNSSYSEQDDDQQQKRQKKVEKYEQKSQNVPKQNQEHSQTIMQLRINRTPRIKIISVDEGIAKKQKHRIEKSKTEEKIICRTPTKQKHNEDQIEKKGSVQEIKQTKKQQKQRKTQQKKKSSDQVVKVAQQDNKKQVQGQKGRQKLPFGYSQFKISVVQRETLLYDILHIQTPEIRNQISDFLQQNDEKFKSYKKNFQELDSDYYDFNLGNLDMDSYILLRKEVDRLMKLQDSLKKNVENKTEKAEITESDIRKENAQ